MDDSLMLLVEQNERLLSALERISDKLDSLSAVEFAIEQLGGRVESGLETLSRQVESINQELQWHEKLSFAHQLIESVDNVAQAVDRSAS